MKMPVRLSLRRATGWLVPGLLLVGCVKWHPESASPDAVAASSPKAIRVERRDGVVVELVRVDVANDTLTGLQPRSSPAGKPLNRVAIPVDQIARIGSRRADSRRMIAGIIALPLAYFASRFLMGL
jgi:hypothetical protein